MPKKTNLPQEPQGKKPAPIKKAVAKKAAGSAENLESRKTYNMSWEPVQVTCPICGNKETAIVSLKDGCLVVELKA